MVSTMTTVPLWTAWVTPTPGSGPIARSRHRISFVSHAKSSPSAILNRMRHVSPVITEYEQQVIRELGSHRVQPNAVSRLPEGVGKPMSKIMDFGRKSQNRAPRGLADHIHGWIEEGLIKTFRVA